MRARRTSQLRQPEPTERKSGVPEDDQEQQAGEAASERVSQEEGEEMRGQEEEGNEPLDRGHVSEDKGLDR